MATFEEDYRNRFGKALNYDPLKPSAVEEIPTPRLALPVGGAGSPTSDPAEASPLDWLKQYDDMAPPQQEDMGFGGALGTVLKSGTVDVGSYLVGAAESGVRSIADRHDSETIRRMADEVQQGLTGARQGLQQTSRDILATLPDEYQQKLQRMIFTADPEQTIFQGNPLDVAGSLMLKLTHMAPASLTTLVGGAVLTRIGLNPAALVWMGGSEAAMSMGGIHNAIAEEIEATDPATLAADSPAYAAMLERGVDPDEAKQYLISEVQGASPIIGGLTVGAISSVAGRFLQPVFEGSAGGAISRFGRGYAAEAPQEAAQGATEALMQNVAAQAYDRDRGLMDGVVQQGLEEGVLGGLFGGAIGAVTPARPEPQVPPPPPPPSTPPDTFEEVFGPNGEAPSAEPFSDLAAQVEEMQVGNRDGVYLSRANLDQFGGVPQELQQAGVVVEDFDGEGGAVIFRDEGTAAMYEQRRQTTPMQTVLGAITGAGAGKPVDGDTAVQRLDEQGNVLQESLVPEREAAVLQQQWQSQYPNDQVVVQPAEGALARREELTGQQALPFDQPTQYPFMGAGVQQEMQYGPRDPEAGQPDLGYAIPLPDGQGQMVGSMDLPPGGRQGEVAVEGPSPADQPLDLGDTTEEVQARTGDLFTGYVPQVKTPDEKPRTRTTKRGRLRREAEVTGRTEGGIIGYQLRFPGGRIEDYDTFEKANKEYEKIKRQDPESIGGVSLVPVRVSGEQRVERSATKAEATTTKTSPSARDREREAKRTARASAEALQAQGVNDLDVSGATSRSKAAARIVSEARRRAREERKDGVDGFLPPKSLEFKNVKQRVRYVRWFNELVEASLIATEISDYYTPADMGYPEVAQPLAAAKKRIVKARNELRKINTVAQPSRKTARLVRAAEELSPGIGEALKSERRTSTQDGETGTGVDRSQGTGFREDDPVQMFQERLTVEMVDQLEGRALDEIFFYAAQIQAGTTQGTAFTYEGLGSATTGAAQESDDVVAARLKANIESLPEGATPISVVKRREKTQKGGRKYTVEQEDGKKKTIRVRLEEGVKLKEIRAVDGPKGGWRYILKQGDQTITGVIYDTYENATKKVSDIVEQHNNSVIKRGLTEVPTFSDIIAAHMNPGDKRKLIKRVINKMRGRKYGGKTKGAKLTSKAKTVTGTRNLTKEELKKEERLAKKEERKPKRTETVERQESESFFDPSVLTNDRVPRDESKKDRKARMERASRTRNELSKTLAKTAGAMDTMSETEYADVLNETNELGNPTQTALNLMVARMYFRQVADFGKALSKSNIDTAAALQQMERVTEFLKRGLDMPPTDFANAISKLAEADIRQSIVSKPVKGDKKMAALKAQLADPKTRRLTMQKYNNQLRQASARAFRMTKIWQQNDLFASSVYPLLRRISDSIMTDGWPSALESFGTNEAQIIEWTLKQWNKETQVKRNGKDQGTFRELMYEPMKRYWQDLGYRFNKDDQLIRSVPAKDEQGNVKKDRDGATIYEDEVGHPKGPTDKALLQALRASEEPVSGQVITRTGEEVGQIIEQFQLGVQQASKSDNEARILAAIERKGRYQQINRVIEQFRKRISQSRVTVQGMIDQEARLVRALKELGIWQDVGKPLPGQQSQGTLGRIKHPSTGVEKVVRLVSGQLQAKLMTKAQAKEQMLKLTPFKNPPVEESIREQVEERANKLLKAETDLLHKAVKLPKYGEGFLDTAVELRARMTDKSFATGHEMLDVILEMVPEGHPYHEVAKRLRALDPTNIAVRWSGKASGFSLPFTSLGRFVSGRGGRGGVQPVNLILINKAAFDKLVVDTDAQNASGAMVHTILHELVHSATTYMLRTDSGTRSGFEQMRTIARRYMREIGRGYGDLYGMRDQDPIEEFVAEAFTNTQFQAMLKDIPIQQETLWNKLISWLKHVLDLNVDGAENMLDLVMATGDRVFSNTAYRGETTFFLENISDPVAKTYVAYGKNFVEGAKMRAVAARKWAGVRAPLGLMTLPQIHTEFKDRLKGLTEYMKAFKNRDARNSELMEVAEKVSRQWTSLTLKHGSPIATAFSENITLQSLHDMWANLPITHEKNAHIKDDPAKAKIHAELRKEFEALPQDFKDHWDTLQEYYAESLSREAVLMAQNAMRAILTGGNDAPMTVETFEKMFPKSRVAEMQTQADFTEALQAYATPEELTTIHAMRSLAQKRNGPYVPFMRYGDYVVEASKVTETKKFGSGKEAKEWAARRRAEDPTLEITVKEQETGATATVTEKTFLLAESPTEAQLKRDELVEEYGEEAVAPVTKKVQYGQASTIASNNALVSILNRLEGNAAAQSAVKQFYLRSLSDSAFRKHEIKRKNRRGFDTKIQHRNFNNYAQSAAYYTAQLEHGWRMERAMRVMDADRKNVADKTSREGVRKTEVFLEIQKRDQLTSDITEINKVVRNVVSFGQFFMLTSPSYWMINGTQPYMVSLPTMAARHGYGATVAAMGRAQKMVGSPLLTQAVKSKAGLKALWDKMAAEEAFGVFEDVVKSIRQRHSDDPAKGEQIIKMLEALRRESILDLSWIAELRDIAEGSDMSRWQKVLDASRIMSHLTEVNNRIMTAIAAYELELASTGDIEAATEYTKQIVEDTHFNYSAGAKPRWFRPDGPLKAAAPLVFQFMQWPQHMYAMLISNMVKVFKAEGVERTEAAKILAGVIGTHMLAGGIVGTMLQPIKWAFGLAMMALGSDDEPYTFESAMSGDLFDRYVQEGLAELVGPNLAEALSRGLPAAFGSDLSSRMSLGTMYFLDLRPETMESTLGSALLSLGGPWLTIGESGFRAAGDIFNGDILRGVERISPKVIRDFMKTYRYASEGLVNTAGDTVLDGDGVPPLELFLQSMGFSSAEVSNFYNRQSVIRDTQRYGQDRKDALVGRFLRTEGAEDRTRLLRQIAEFNRAFPADAINGDTLKNARQRQGEREASYQRHGANLRGKARVYADEGWYFQ